VSLVLTLTIPAIATMRAHAERAFPEECVGAVLSDGTVLPLENAAADRRSGFLVSARDYLAAERHADQHGVTLRGFYHSHPDGPAEPSVADVEHAIEGFVTIIVPVIDGVAGVPS
jgi:proteasome lid subunit RPN8/RPN11